MSKNWNPERAAADPWYCGSYLVCGQEHHTSAAVVESRKTAVADAEKRGDLALLHRMLASGELQAGVASALRAAIRRLEKREKKGASRG